MATNRFTLDQSLCKTTRPQGCAERTTAGRAPVCGCGQWLDTCSGARCPRCGVAVRG